MIDDIEIGGDTKKCALMLPLTWAESFRSVALNELYTDGVVGMYYKVLIAESAKTLVVLDQVEWLLSLMIGIFNSKSISPDDIKVDLSPYGQVENDLDNYLDAVSQAIHGDAHSNPPQDGELIIDKLATIVYDGLMELGVTDYTMVKFANDNIGIFAPGTVINIPDTTPEEHIISLFPGVKKGPLFNMI